jgi:peptidoglycan/xylan/chitin deacetylase (PgdA/CDA1 family)
MSISSSSYNLVLNLKNIPGWHTARKILVIESDDWGGIRFPSKKIYNMLEKAGVPLTKGYMRYDSLESAKDLEALFDVLESVKDRNKRCAVISPAVNVANPDFKRIRAFGFIKYYYEKFSDTLSRLDKGPDTIHMWQQGIEAGIFIPELHGREHISVQFWLEKLREGNKDLLLAFDNEVASVDNPGVKPVLQGFRPEFYFDSGDQKQFLEDAIREAHSLFNNIFGYKPLVFVPTNGIFHPDFDDTLAKCGLKFVNVNHFSLMPNGKGGLKFRFSVTGQKVKSGMRYYIRNCAFEPSSESYKGIELTLKQIEIAFKWRKPAIISNHRANFVGSISVENRENGLRELHKLLLAIVTRWPDVEFLSSREALNYLNETNR